MPGFTTPQGALSRVPRNLMEYLEGILGWGKP